MNYKFEVSIDKLTILGDEVVERFEETLNNNHFGFIKSSGLAQHPYRRNYYMTDRSILQWTDIATHKALRYEFNPNRVRGDGQENTYRRSVFDIIRTMKYPSFSRIDIAVDIYDVDLSGYEVVYSHPVKSKYYLDASKRMESFYLGSKNSDHVINIYNKTVEQESENRDKNWWRVEVRISGEMCKLYQELGEPILSTIFRGLKFIKPNYKAIKDIRTRSVIYYLIHNPNDWKELSVNTRSKYKKILSELPSEEEVIDIDSLFVPECSRIRKELRDWLRIAERNNVI